MTHPLKAWVARQTPKLTMLAFAGEVGCHVITLRRLMNGEDVSRELFEDIERATNGELRAVDLYAHYDAQRKAAREAAERERA